MDTKDKFLPKFPLGAALLGGAPFALFLQEFREKDNPHKAAYKKRLEEEKKSEEKMRHAVYTACYRQSNMDQYLNEVLFSSEDVIDQGYETRYD